jgi:hypothetical protein
MTQIASVALDAISTVSESRILHRLPLTCAGAPISACQLGRGRRRRTFPERERKLAARQAGLRNQGIGQRQPPPNPGPDATFAFPRINPLNRERNAPRPGTPMCRFPESTP